VRPILILRHGESEWNRDRRWQGWEDIALTADGEAQARARAADLEGAGHQFVAIYASDLVRAARTAELISEALGATPAPPQAELRERFGGAWQGRTRDEIDRRWPDEIAAWRSGELAAPPDGETDAEVLTRVDAALARIDGAHPAGPILIVTHHGVVRLLSSRAGVERDRLIPNLGGRWFEWDGSVLHAGAAVAPLTPS
jgi:broad specificity phosphatase PhoE